MHNYAHPTRGSPGLFFFALGILRASQEIAELIGGAAAHDTDQLEVTAVGYADDTYLVGDRVDICEKLPTVRGILHDRAGLVLQPSKSELLTTARRLVVQKSSSS